MELDWTGLSWTVHGWCVWCKIYDLSVMLAGASPACNVCLDSFGTRTPL